MSELITCAKISVAWNYVGNGICYETTIEATEVTMNKATVVLNLVHPRYVDPLARVVSPKRSKNRWGGRTGGWRKWIWRGRIQSSAFGTIDSIPFTKKRPTHSS